MFKDNIQNKQKNKDVQGQYPKQVEKQRCTRTISKTSRKIKMYKDNIQNKQKNKDVQGQYPKQVEPEALKSLYRSPGYKKNQLVLCKNYVLQW